MSSENYIENVEKKQELSQKFRDLVYFIANDYIELSYEKAQWQRNDWVKRCRELIQEERVALYDGEQDEQAKDE